MAKPYLIYLAVYAMVTAGLVACVDMVNIKPISIQSAPTTNSLMATPLLATPLLAMTEVASADIMQARATVEAQASATAEAVQSLATMQAVRATATFETLIVFPHATVNTAALNLREGPDIIYPTLRSYRSDTVVKVLGKETSEQWLKVETPDEKVGWMSIKYLRFSFNLADIPVVDVPPTPVPPG